MSSFRIPIMQLGVLTPDEFLGDVRGDLHTRRAHVLSIEAEGDRQLIAALVSMLEIGQYADDLNRMTAGRASYWVHLSHYDGEGDEPGEGAGRPAPLNPRPPTRWATDAAEPPRDDSEAID